MRSSRVQLPHRLLAVEPPEAVPEAPVERRKPRPAPKPSLRYQAIRAEAAHVNLGHVYADGCLPGVFFYKYLASVAQVSTTGGAPEITPPSKAGQLQLKCWIPDTIVFGGSFPPIWIYSDKNGVVKKTVQFHDNHVLDKLGNRRFENDPVMLFKEPVLAKAGAGQTVLGNNIKLLSTVELRSALTKAVGTPVTFALQKYVKPKGPKAFLVRGVYKAGKAPSGWMINNKLSFQCHQAEDVPDIHRFCAMTGVDNACSFVKLSERACTDVYDINLRIVKYLEQALRIALECFVADFIKDDFGQWWLIQVKAFQLKHIRPGKINTFAAKLMGAYERSIVADDVHDDDEMTQDDSKPHNQKNWKVHKMFPCKFCQVLYFQSELGYKMTMKMMHETISRLNLRGCINGENPQQTLFHTKFDVDSGLFYQTWNVCNLCYALYERDQLLLQIETKFSMMLGCPMKSMQGGGITYITESHVCKSQPLLAEIPNELTLCRLMFFFTALYDIPKELFEAERALSLDATQKGRRSRLYLRFSVLGFDNFIPVDLQSMVESSSNEDKPTVSYWIPLNITRCFHCFAPKTPLQSKLRENSGLSIFLADESTVTVQLIRCSDTLHVHNDVLLEKEALMSKLQNKWAPHEATTRRLRKPAMVASPNKYSVVLGSTHIQMFQFRSSYVTKTDIYASMSMGDLFNLKGNVGFERLRVIPSKYITAQYKLRQYCGVFVPDTSYCTNDKLATEWMDSIAEAYNTTKKDLVVPKAGMDNFLKTLHGSSASLASSQPDSELEELIEATSQKAPPPQKKINPTMLSLVKDLNEEDEEQQSQESSLSDEGESPRAFSSKLLVPSTWCITIMLHRVHNWHPPEGLVGWEAQYTFLGQTRRAAQRNDGSDKMAVLDDDRNEIVFDCTHKNYVQGNIAAIQSIYSINHGLCRVTLVHSCHRDRRVVRPTVDIELAGLRDCRTIDGTFIIHDGSQVSKATKSAQYPPYLSVSIFVVRVSSDSSACENGGIERGFVSNGTTPEGLVLLRRLP